MVYIGSVFHVFLDVCSKNFSGSVRNITEQFVNEFILYFSGVEKISF